MSRIGKMSITIPDNVTVSVQADQIVVKGPKGELQLNLPPGFELDNQAKIVRVVASKEGLYEPNIHGLFRSLLNNAIIGVTQGWEKTVELVGVGYRATGGGQELNLTVGFSHPVKMMAPAGVGFTLGKTTITISGIDKKQVGEIAAKVRAVRPPEPYKGKGIRYSGEIVRKKAGKAVKTAGVPG